jgi:diguanylate cyclase (GGDEF)-like protein/PAS domain S-box-containing protein
MPAPHEVDPSSLVEASPDAVFVLTRDGLVAYVNRRCEELLDRARTEVIGRGITDFVHPDDVMLAGASLVAVVDKRRSTPVEVRIAARGWRWVEVVGADCTSTPGIGGILCTARDLTQRRMWEVAGRDTTRFAQVVHHAAAVVLSLRPDGVVSGVNGAFTRLLGHYPSAVVGRPLTSFVAAGHAGRLEAALAAAEPGTVATVEMPMRHSGEGPPVPLRFEIVDLRDDPIVGGLVVTGQDVRDLHEARQRLEYLARHDPLTGLPNRTLIYERLEVLVESGRPLALLYVDLDQFKAVNDTWGHEAGDELLRAVSQRLAGGVGAADLVARFGGDEFVVLAEGIDDAAAATAVAGRLERVLRAPYLLSCGTVGIGASVGAVVARPGGSADALLASADQAMYARKGARRAFL